MVLILTLLATSGAMAFEFKDTFYSPIEIDTYHNEFWKEVERISTISISAAEFQKLKPSFSKFSFVTQKYHENNPQYAVKLVALPGFEEFLEKENYPGYRFVYIYTSPTIDGEYTQSDFARFDFGGYDYAEGCAVFQHMDLKGQNYAKIQYRIDISDKAVYSQLSDPVKIPVKTASKPSVKLYKISSSEFFAEVSKQSKETRVLQIREKGTSKWYSLSKSPLVKSYETRNTGYLLKMASSKDYEVRARNYIKTNGKKGYSDYVYAKEYSNLKAKVSDISFLRYNKNSYMLTITDWDNRELSDYKYNVQVAYRKSGTSKWSYTTAIEYDSDLYRRGWSMPAKYGYEYKFRIYEPILPDKKVKGSWSKVFKCTNKSASFINEASIRDTTSDHLIYDHSKTYEENYARLQSRIPKYNLHLLTEEGLKLNYADVVAYTVKVDRSKENKNLVGVHVFGSQYWEEILEILCFYAEDNEVGYALLGWWKAACDYGAANSDYFGFKDVKSTRNGFIMEMNGQQIEVEHVDNGTIYWFNMND